MYEWKNVGIDLFVNVDMYVWMNERIDILSVNVDMYIWMNEWIDVRVNEWMNEWIND